MGSDNEKTTSVSGSETDQETSSDTIALETENTSGIVNQDNLVEILDANYSSYAGFMMNRSEIGGIVCTAICDIAAYLIQILMMTMTLLKGRSTKTLL